MLTSILLLIASTPLHVEFIADPVSTVVLSRDDRLVAAATRDRIRIMAIDKSAKDVVVNTAFPVETMAFTPGNRELVVIERGKAKFARHFEAISHRFDVATGKEIDKTSHGIATVAELSSDGTLLAFQPEDKRGQCLEVVVADTKSGKTKAKLKMVQCTKLAFSNDNQRLGMLAFHGIGCGRKVMWTGALSVWDLEKDREIAKTVDPISEVRFLPDSDRLAIRLRSDFDDGKTGEGYEKKIEVASVNRANEKRVRLLAEPSLDESPVFLSVAEYKNRIAARHNGDVVVWDSSTGNELRRLTHNQDHGITALQISSTGRVLVTGDSQGVIRVWEVETGKVRRRIEP